MCEASPYSCEGVKCSLSWLDHHSIRANAPHTHTSTHTHTERDTHTHAHKYEMSEQKPSSHCLTLQRRAPSPDGDLPQRSSQRPKPTHPPAPTHSTCTHTHSTHTHLTLPTHS